MSREIEVWADWRELGEPVLMGRLRATETRGKEIFSFEYDSAWLKRGFSTQLDPDLRFLDGPQYLDAVSRPNFGIFLDSSPDRWGRVLMQRREAVRAREQSRPERRLLELDYLLGVDDEQRSGAVRFREPETGGGWVSDDATMAAPPWTSLRELQQASWKLQQDDPRTDPDYLKWLSLMIAPGSSLGGARPKAGVRDDDGHLWIAKFPGRNDAREIAAWEMVAHCLAIRSGIRMSQSRLEAFGDGHRTFLAQRFDRAIEGGVRKRIHFASAMTLLGYNDGAGGEHGVSYLELAEWLIRHGAKTKEDLQELWRRIVFSIAIQNTDDHLRNHGFLLTPDGWRLSPAYDINPDPNGTGLSLNISETDNSLSFDLAREVAESFRLPAKESNVILEEVQTAVSSWREIASGFRIGRAEQDMVASAFSEG